MLRARVERCFAELTQKQIRRGSHRSVPELERAIREFIDAHNAEPKPFVWTQSADEILASITRFDSAHSPPMALRIIIVREP